MLFGSKVKSNSESKTYVDISYQLSYVPGPPLPHTTIFSGQMVSANDHSAVYYLGGWLGSDIGQTNQVYKMTCSNNQDDSCAWEDLGGLMDHPRDDFVTMFVPDDLATCS